MRSLRREQAREVDRIAMEDLCIPGIVLMENAARGLAEAVCSLPGRSGPGPVAIVCGPGNNGGDGFAAARHLSNSGVAVRLHLVVSADAYPDGSDAALNLVIARRMELEIRDGVDGLEDASVILDAVFGTGLSRVVREPYRSAILAINAAGKDVVAVDVPSGLDANTGAIHGVCVRATVTATMVAPKAGFALNEGPAHVGRVEVLDIGVPPAVVDRVLAADA